MPFVTPDKLQQLQIDQGRLVVRARRRGDERQHLSRYTPHLS